MFEKSELRDRAYYLRRALLEHTAAANAGDRTAELAHLKLAQEYERLAERPYIMLTT